MIKSIIVATVIAIACVVTAGEFISTDQLSASLTGSDSIQSHMAEIEKAAK